MSWKSWIPYKGDKDVREKLRDLDRQGVGVPLVIVLFFQKGFEGVVKNTSRLLGLAAWMMYFLVSALVFVAWVYNNQIRRKASEAKEKVEEKAETKN